MIKPANLAIVAFIILGALMWFAASSSLGQYIAEYQQAVTKQLPKGSELTIGNVQLSASQSSGEITNFSLSIPTANASTVSVKTNNISWEYQKKSLKKAVVVVDSVYIAHLEIVVPQDIHTQAISEVKKTIQSLIATAVKQQTGLNGKQEFLVNINKLSIENLYVTLMNGNTPHQEEIFNNISVQPEVLTHDNIMSVAAAELILTTLTMAEQKLVQHEQQ